jgi:hypothetical protein
MSTAFLDDIQIDECIDFDEMFDVYEDNWESVTETDMEDWILIED